MAGYDYASWLGYYVPRGTPRPVIDKLNGAFVKAIQAEESREFFRRMGIIGVSSTPEGLTAFTKEQIASWERWVKASGMQAQ